jgi:hypothetical protein
MGFIAKLLKSFLKDKLNHNPFDLWEKDCWEVSGPKDFPSFFRGLIGFLPEGAIMRFESSSPSGEIATFLASNAISEKISIPKGTIWPKCQVFNISATDQNLLKLSELTEKYANPEVADHFHIYLNDYVLIDWYDAFNDPMYVSKKISETKIATFCDSLSMTYKEHLENVEPVISADR